MNLDKVVKQVGRKTLVLIALQRIRLTVLQKSLKKVKELEYFWGRRDGGKGEEEKE